MPPKRRRVTSPAPDESQPPNKRSANLKNMLQVCSNATEANPPPKLPAPSPQPPPKQGPKRGRKPRKFRYNAGSLFATVPHQVPILLPA